MTDLTVNQLAWLRSELGQEPDDTELQVKFDRLESVRDVAIEVVRERRQALLDSPLSVSVSGVASVNNTENVKALERRLTALTRLDDDPTDTPGEDVDGGGAVPRFEQFTLTRSRGR